MEFWQAMKSLQEGKSVRCKDWFPNSHAYLTPLGVVLFGIEGRLDIYIHYDWELYEQPIETYTFMEILPGLQEGKVYSRKGRVWKVYKTNSGNHEVIIGVFRIEDFEACDWIEVTS